jgi:hypothetical protein
LTPTPTLALALALALTGCGREPDTEAVKVVCFAVECPGTDEVVALVDRFDIGPEPLLVEWYAKDAVFNGLDGEAGYDPDQPPEGAAGLTLGPNHVKVTGFRYLCHEIMHVRFWRAGTPDANHEVAPGPWTDADNVFYKIQCSEVGYPGGT